VLTIRQPLHRCVDRTRVGLTARVDQEAGERKAAALGVKRLASSGQLAHSFQVIRSASLRGWSSHSPES
jgi:hypothetical protein